MIRLRGVRVDPGDHLMYVRLLKIPGNYCLVLLCQIVPVLFDMAYSALKTPDSNLDCSRLSLEQGDYHLSDKVVLGKDVGVAGGRVVLLDVRSVGVEHPKVIDAAARVAAGVEAAAVGLVSGDSTA